MIVTTGKNNTALCGCQTLMYISARHRRRIDQNQRMNAVGLDNKNGQHRTECQCATCVIARRPCYNCGRSQILPAPRNGPPVPAAWPNGQPYGYAGAQPGFEPRPGPPNPYLPGYNPGTRPPFHRLSVDLHYMDHEDLRTWSLAYSLSIQVYVCAERYCLPDFKSRIAAYVINRYAILI